MVTSTRRTLRDSRSPISSTSPGTSKTSWRHSRTASRTIGNEPNSLATWSSWAARWRCCHSGVRLPGLRRGSSSARAAHSRKRDANSAEPPTWSVTIWSTSPLSKTTSAAPTGAWSASYSVPGLHRFLVEQVQAHQVGVGQAQHDAVVGVHDLGVHAVPLGEPGAEGERPRGVHLGAEGGVHDDPPVAQLVAEALDDDRAVVRDVAAGLALLVQVATARCRRPRRPGPRRAAAGGRPPRAASRPRAGTRPPRGPVRAGGPAGRPSRTAAGRATPGAGETRTRSRVMSSMRQELVPSVNTSPTRDS